ncbi:hypothetical protein D0869_10017 [Hortaea werneckii]|uniref:GATA-type domain-containing protein n=1 Tax=Hortaea werneckii TaxID=91943 RepID=A0A3M6Z1D9_HORWE|nr:hypothetical protein D0869_10017 [Hortaea werneckii]RMX90955.1 hypothetical protein D0868_14272 [Hortaea werneckii]RMY09176.1 hypothetical protein D0867_08795 [Hortaea werneckii]RMY16562.1 hypothetical protein D0866_13656 [Hortaea werneckii]
MQTQTPPQTCTGCRKQKSPEDFWRYNRTNLTCNACSERHRTRKAKTAAAAAQQNQQQQAQQPQQPPEDTTTTSMKEVLRRGARNAYHNKDDHEHNQEQLEVVRRTKATSTTPVYTTRHGPVVGSQRVMQLAPNRVKREGSGTSSWGCLSASSAPLVD